jgi:nicotinamide-nucleotide amidase
MSAVRAVVLSIGDELLDGRIVDSNAPYLAEELLKLGYRVQAMYTVGDAPGELLGLLRELRERGALVVSSGGLGPTADDRVRDEAAELLGVGLSVVPGALEPLQTLWERHHDGPAPQRFCNQARVPEGTTALRNTAGTAWGFRLQSAGLHWVALPGPPRECAATWESDARAALAGAAGTVCALGVLHSCGLPESRIEALVHDRFDREGGPRVGITARADGVSLSVLAEAADAEQAAAALEAELAALRERLGEWCWERDEQTLAGVVVDALRSRGQSVTVAESCTGGLLGGALTAVPGSSAVFQRGWLTYADEAKHAELGVAQALLDTHGAVSVEVAEAMAVGARHRSGADWALSVTGIAGPDGGRPDKPVGTVCFGWASAESSGAVHRRQYARAGRAAVRAQSVRDALDLLRRQLASLPPLRATGLDA